MISITFFYIIELSPQFPVSLAGISDVSGIVASALVRALGQVLQPSQRGSDFDSVKLTLP